MITIKDLVVPLNKQSLKIKNFTFKKGLNYVILGPSGVGKSTFLNIIGNLSTDYSGKIENYFNSVSYAFQENRLIPWLTVEDNLNYVLNSNIEFDSLLKMFKISHLKHNLVKNLSGGEKQRVALARAFVNKSELILMDENLSSLNLKLKISIIEEMNIHLTKNNQTLIYVSHNIDEALLIADTVILFDDNGNLTFSIDICIDKSQRKNKFEEFAFYEKVILNEMMK